MNPTSYYDVARADLDYLNFNYGHLDELPNFNSIVVQEQQVVEKLLKHILNIYVDSDDAIRVMKSHKLAHIVREIGRFYDCPLNEDDMRFLSDFYFDGRYPSRDYVLAEKQDAIRGYEIVQETLLWVNSFISEHGDVRSMYSF